jgi:hypothetical protein
MREVTEADVASLRGFVERSLFSVYSSEKGVFSKQRLSLEKFVESMRFQSPDKRSNEVAEALRAIDLIKCIENGYYQPSPYRKPVVTEKDED